RIGTALFFCNHDVDVDLAIARDGLLYGFASVWRFVDQFPEDDIAHGETERGQRDRAVAQLPDQVVVTSAASDGAKFSGTVEHLKHDSRIISKTADDSDIDRHEICQPTNSQVTDKFVKLLALTAAF